VSLTKLNLHTLALAFYLGLASTASAQTPAVPEPQNTDPTAEPVVIEKDVLGYPAAFFARFRPDSALDMLNQLPGFRLNFGGELRGYGSDTGNVLIDGRRPSSKRVTVPSILDRIPASQVERIELIRGPVRDIELLGEPQVANVVLRTDTPAAVRWSAVGYRNSDMPPLPWFTNISLSDRWRGIDFNGGLDIFRKAFSERNDEDIVDGSGNLTEERFEHGYQKEFEANFDLTASKWIGDTLFTWNSQIGIQDGGEKFTSDRTPVGQGTRNELTEGISDEFQFEAGITVERNLTDTLAGNLLLFATREAEDASTTQRSINAAGMQTAETIKDTYQIEKEFIARTEFEWSGWNQHTVRLNLEGSYNLVDNEALQTLNTGAGPVSVIVPGATTAISEDRADFLLKDTWSLGKYELDYGMGAEASKLSQTGDPEVERKLFYLKPHAELSYTPVEERKMRFRIARDVAQLLFDDFFSASLLLDDDVSLGNPNLKPETTWKSEFGYEQRFGSQSVVKVTLFHHWITDVQDLIPVSLDDEAPGNIGDGKRWGLQLEGTLHLGWAGLDNARLNINSRWQDSSVVDPVTGEDRVLTATILADSNNTRSIFDNDNAYVVVLDFRQDFEEERVAWGSNVTFEADLKQFKVNEYDLRKREPDLNLFVETTRWFGMKVRLEFNNVLDQSKERIRTFYTTQRGLSPILRRQLQDRTDGREIGISLSGSF
jgi:outer membrane receptor protein involved in Fe transport